MIKPNSKPPIHQDTQCFALRLGLGIYHVQWSLYFKTTHGALKMWPYITGGLKIKVLLVHKNDKTAFWDQTRWSYNQDGIKIKGSNKVTAVLAYHCMFMMLIR